jgi:hypothetical protein
VLAEYLVGYALDVLDQPRVEWDACDLRYRGKRIEVKASAYLQSWDQKRLSTLVFDIGRHVAWDAGTNTFAAEPLRTADCYVFSVFTDKDRKDCVVADVSRWLFYVVPTTTLDERFGSQKTRAPEVHRARRNFRALRAVAHANRPRTGNGSRHPHRLKAPPNHLPDWCRNKVR